MNLKKIVKKRVTVKTHQKKEKRRCKKKWVLKTLHTFIKHGYIVQVKQLGNKLRNFKNKEDNAKKERIALKEIIKKHQAAIKEEKKRYNKIKKEVHWYVIAPN